MTIPVLALPAAGAVDYGGGDIDYVNDGDYVETAIDSVPIKNAAYRDQMVQTKLNTLITAFTTTWTIEAGTFTATPASTSTITMTADLTATIRPGFDLKYTIGGVDYYGSVTALAANLMTIEGAPLSGDIQALYYRDRGGPIVIEKFISSTYGDGAADLLVTDMNQYAKWGGIAAYCVGHSVVHKTADTGAAQPKVNIKIGGAAVWTNDTNLGTQLSTGGTWVTSSAVAVNTTNYVTARAAAIEIACTAAGSNSNAANLSVQIRFVPK